MIETSPKLNERAQDKESIYTHVVTPNETTGIAYRQQVLLENPIREDNLT